MKRAIVYVFFMCLFSAPAIAQTTEFTFQGNITNSGSPVNGTLNMSFAVFDALTAGNQVGSLINLNSVTVANGSFAVKLDFGAVFPGAARFLEIQINTVNQQGMPVTILLTPRQRINSAPYSVKSLTADLATNATQLGGVAANQYVLSGDARLSDARPPTAGSSNYIQNTTSQQANSNFNISGSGIVGGTLSVGNAGSSGRMFLNRAAAVGGNSSDVNFYTGGAPDFSLGTSQGSATPSDFSIYNYGTGSNALTIQRSNGNVGIGVTSTPYKFNVLSTTSNAFATHIQTEGLPNDSSFGLVISAGTSSSDVSFQARNQSGTSLMLVRGDGNVGLNMNPGSNRFAVNHTTPNAFATSIQTTGIPTASSYGLLVQAGTDSTDSALQLNSQSGTPFMRVRGNGYVGIGTTDALNRLHVAGSSVGAFSARIDNGASGSGSNGLMINAGDSTLNWPIFVMDRTGGNFLFGVRGNGTVQIGDGAADLTGRLSVNGNTQIIGNTIVTGTLRVDTMSSIFSNQGTVCLSGNNELRFCTSSIRYKSNVADFQGGLDIVMKLRPVTFDWKGDGVRDLGLIAEEVSEIHPLLAITRSGLIDGVKYDRMGVVLINAVKEQQAEIEKLQIKNRSLSGEIVDLRDTINAQKEEVNALKTIVCSLKPEAATCRPLR